MKRILTMLILALVIGAGAITSEAKTKKRSSSKPRTTQTQKFTVAGKKYSGVLQVEKEYYESNIKFDSDGTFTIGIRESLFGYQTQNWVYASGYWEMVGNSVKLSWTGGTLRGTSKYFELSNQNKRISGRIYMDGHYYIFDWEL